MLSFIGVMGLLMLTLVDGFWHLMGKLPLVGAIGFLMYQLITFFVGG